MALTINAGEWACYLDVWNGEVQMIWTDGFRDDDDWPSGEDLDARLAEGHVLHVEPLGSAVEYGWMVDSSVDDARLREGRLEVALDGRGAFRRFRSMLFHHPAEREGWFAFRDQRLHSAAREWLSEHEIEPTTAPQSKHEQ